jgi:hypothetical protein
VRMASVPMVVILDLLLLCFLRLFAALLNDLDVVVQDRGDYRHHVCLNDSGPYCLGATNAYVNDALKCQVPFPHVHHVLAPALFENADEPFNAAILPKNITNPSRRRCEVREVVEGVNEW